jgi:hypothetical protein
MSENLPSDSTREDKELRQEPCTTARDLALLDLGFSTVERDVEMGSRQHFSEPEARHLNEADVSIQPKTVVLSVIPRLTLSEPGDRSVDIVSSIF